MKAIELKNYTTSIKSFSSVFFPKIKLRIGLTKSGGLLCSKNNGLAKLSNGPCGIVTLLVHDGVVTLLQTTPDNSKPQRKSKKVRVIGSLKQITGSKEISKWMGRKGN